MSTITVDLTNIGGFLNGYYDFELGLPITPYAGLGIGIVNSAADAASFDGFGNSFVVEADETNFGYQFMLGTDYGLTDALFLSGELRFQGAAVEGDVGNNFIINAGLKYKF